LAAKFPEMPPPKCSRYVLKKGRRLVGSKWHSGGWGPWQTMNPQPRQPSEIGTSMRVTHGTYKRQSRCLAPPPQVSHTTGMAIRTGRNAASRGPSAVAQVLRAHRQQCGTCSIRRTLSRGQLCARAQRAGTTKGSAITAPAHLAGLLTAVGRDAPPPKVPSPFPRAPGRWTNAAASSSLALVWPRAHISQGRLLVGMSWRLR
jgi:hypothetical protein